MQQHEHTHAAAQSLASAWIEVPDSRFLRFERAGEAQLIADCACSHDMAPGAAIAPDERVQRLPEQGAQAGVSDGRRPEGVGANALRSPVEALAWLVNELSATGRTLEAGQFVTTGACVPAIPVDPGQRVTADFGWLGRVWAEPPIEYDLADAASAHAMLASRQATRPIVLRLS